MGYKSGYIGVFGRPNVGKSTLLNRLIGEKVSIVSKKPHTTRDAILGIRFEPEAELLFLDTPGFDKTSGPLHQLMRGEFQGAVDSAQIALVLVTPPLINSMDRIVIEHIKQRSIPTIIVINKIDRQRDKRLLLPLIEELSQFGAQEVVPVSALRGEGINKLIEMIQKYLPEGEK